MSINFLPPRLRSWLEFSLEKPEIWPLAFMIISLGSLGFAFYFQYIEGLDPCILCLYQRIPYAAVLLLGFVFFFAKSPRLIARGLGIIALVFLGGAALAFYHIGVEQHWWQMACIGGIDPSASIDELMAQIMMHSEVPCDKIAWTLFGLSMTTYNFMLSIFLCAASSLGALLIHERYQK